MAKTLTVRSQKLDPLEAEEQTNTKPCIENEPKNKTTNSGSFVETEPCCDWLFKLSHVVIGC